MLFITVAPKPRVKLIDWPTNSVSIEGAEFVLQEDESDATGFYDFLRTAQGQIVGVGFSPFPQLDYLWKSVAAGSGLSVSGRPPLARIELFFDLVTKIDDASSGDQYTNENYIFKSLEVYGITFPLSYLPENERIIRLERFRLE